MLTSLPFRSRRPSSEAQDASRCARESAVQAEADRQAAASRRREAEHLERKLRAHNTANRYDDWLRQMVGGQG